MVACSTSEETGSAGKKQLTAERTPAPQGLLREGHVRRLAGQSRHLELGGNEILVGFGMGYYKDQGRNHHIDREKPEIPMLARSLDGGETWSIEDPGAKGFLLTEGGYLHGVTRPGVTIPPLRESEGGIDFTHPDFALTVRTNSIHTGIGRIFYSYDRGRTWDGPFRLPSFDTPGIAPRTDYIIDDKETCTLFITAAKANGREGRPLCVRTTDSGKTWKFVSWIGPEPEGFSIMPASLRLSDTDILVTVRVREAARRWIGTYLSTDNGAGWEYLNEAVPDAGVGQSARHDRAAGRTHLPALRLPGRALQHSRRAQRRQGEDLERPHHAPGRREQLGCRLRESHPKAGR